MALKFDGNELRDGNKTLCRINGNDIRDVNNRTLCRINGSDIRDVNNRTLIKVSDAARKIGSTSQGPSTAAMWFMFCR